MSQKAARRLQLQCSAQKSVSPFQSSSNKPAQSQAVQQQQQQQAQELQPASSSWQQGMATHKWQWRDSSINYVTAGCGKPVMLVHGFGASAGHYRKTIPYLAQNGFKVYAIDLIGFGASDKPVQQYTIELWAELIVDFMAEFMPGTPAVIVGNSIGSLSCLTAAAAAPEGQLAGLVLLNSAGAMNNKGVINDWRIVLALPLLLLIDFLLKTPPIARALFDALARPETIRKVLGGVYVDKAAVDDELVDIILAPAFTPNALDVFVSVITGPAGPKPWDLLRKVSCPLFVAWGDTDPFTPIDGPVGKYFLDLSSSRPDTQFAVLPGVGHCPQDDRPELLHEQLLPWLKQRWA
uniref:AB hydrolase-1 domain-containing protein n=1 Tax=Tetradesmus obliquus TaxID=3088 RepID=A0A383WBY5_TETOB|eukprot:jgi/Sobl393_1/15260/SZX75128.1